MPNMDGVTAIRKLREAHPLVCLIALTGDESPAIHDEATNAGADDVLVKGQMLEALVERLKMSPRALVARAGIEPATPRSSSRSPARSPASLDAVSLGYTPPRGEVAQSVEHTAENRGVAGSIPALAIRPPRLSGGHATKRTSGPVSPRRERPVGANLNGPAPGVKRPVQSAT